MAKSFDYQTLLAAVSGGSGSGGAAAFRCRATLQPGGGDGDKVFPPTYAGAVYATEDRRVPGYHKDDPEKRVPCVLLDSVQSQANRIEEALQDAIDEQRIELPLVVVDFNHLDLLEPGIADQDDDVAGLYEPIDRVTSLQAPHRVADAILRDSETEDGTAFRQSPAGKKLDRAGLRNATPVYEICPTALLLGLWDSTGPKGGLGVKFQRALVSEIIGINAVKGVKTSSRIDPLAIQKNSALLYQSAKDEHDWVIDPEQAAQDKKKKPITIGKDGKPSEANHGNVTPSVSDLDREREPLAGGVTIDKAELITVISIPALRRLRFPVDGEQTAERNAAARAVIAAIGLCGTALMTEAGLDLRSRCLLVAKKSLEWEQVVSGGESTRFTLSADDAVKLLADAVAAAEKAGLTWLKEPLQLRPSAKLAKLLQKSQALAVKSGGDAGEGGGE